MRPMVRFPAALRWLGMILGLALVVVAVVTAKEEEEGPCSSGSCPAATTVGLPAQELVLPIFTAKEAAEIERRRKAGEVGAGSKQGGRVSTPKEVRMPLVGFGTAALGESTEWATQTALGFGFPMLDTAQAPEWYREMDVARALYGYVANAKRALQLQNQKPISPIERIVVVTKIHPRHYGLQRTKEAVADSVRIFEGLELPIDLVVLLHSSRCWPGMCEDYSGAQSWREAWRALEECYDDGLIAGIGVSNFHAPDVRELLNFARYPPMVLQNWMDPFHADKEVREICAAHGIVYMAYSTLGTQWKYIPSRRRNGIQDENPVLTNAAIGQVAEKHGITPAVATLMWAMERGAVVLPRSANEEHIRELADQLILNVDSNVPLDSARSQARSVLDEEDLAMIDALDGTLD